MRAEIQQVIISLLKEVGKTEPVQLRPGQIITVWPKEIQGNTAVLICQGREILARLETPVPAGEQLRCLVEGEKDGQIVLRVLSGSQEGAPGQISRDIVRNLGLVDDKLNLRLVSEMAKQEMPLAPATARVLAAFIRTSPVPEEDVWLPVFMQQKGIPLSGPMYKAIKELLTGMNYLQAEMHRLLVETQNPAGPLQPGSELHALAARINQAIMGLQLTGSDGQAVVAAKLAALFQLLNPAAGGTIRAETAGLPLPPGQADGLLSGAGQPGAGQPGPVQSGSGQLPVTEAGTGDYQVVQPGTGEPPAVQAGTGELPAAQPGTGQSRAGLPGVEQPEAGPSGAGPSSAEPSGTELPGTGPSGAGQADPVQTGAVTRAGSPALGVAVEPESVAQAGTIAQAGPTVQVSTAVQSNPAAQADPAGQAGAAAQAESAVQAGTAAQADPAAQVKPSALVAGENGSVFSDSRPVPATESTLLREIITRLAELADQSPAPVDQPAREQMFTRIHAVLARAGAEAAPEEDLLTLLDRFVTGLTNFRGLESDELVQLTRNVMGKLELIQNFNSKAEPARENMMIFYSTVRFGEKEEPLRLIVNYRYDSKGKKRDFSTCRVEIKLNTPRLGLVKCEVQVNNRNLNLQFVADNEPASRIIDGAGDLLVKRLEELQFTVRILPCKVHSEQDAGFPPGEKQEFPALFHLNLRV